MSDRCTECGAEKYQTRRRGDLRRRSGAHLRTSDAKPGRSRLVRKPRLSAYESSFSKPRQSIGVSRLLSIVVPVYNEEATVGELIERLLAIELPVAREILVINDRLHRWHSLRAQYVSDHGERLRIVHATANGGKGTAIRIGLEHARGTIVAIQDADLELDPAELARW